MLYQVAILAGGKGKRLSSLYGDIPKPMVPVMGHPILQHQIELCRRNGFTRIVLLVHHKASTIKNYFGDGSKFGVSISYIHEKEPLGTGGALLPALDLLGDTFFVLYADTYADIDLLSMWDFHIKNCGMATLLLHPNSHPQDSDIVELDHRGVVKAIHGYPHESGEFYRNLVNAALYVINGVELKKYIPEGTFLDLAKDIFPKMIADQKIYGYVSSEYIKDMGTVDRLSKVERDIKFGLPELLSCRVLKTAVFIDRDGTINKEINGVTTPLGLELIDGSALAIRHLNEAGILSICITNQPLIAKGKITDLDLNNIHAKLDYDLGKHGAYLDRIYYCPHYPESGYEGEIRELKIKCGCRKPGVDLINGAISALGISRNTSWMIGDSTVDIEAGRKSGLNTILVKTGYGGTDKKYSIYPDFIFDDLADAVDWIINGYKRLENKILPLISELRNHKIILIGGCSKVGKSTASQVMRMTRKSCGRDYKIIPLDFWLLSPRERVEGGGVLTRYDVKGIVEFAKFLSDFDSNELIKGFQLKSKLSCFENIRIRKNDFLIIEGVPALLIKELRECTSARIFIDLDDFERLARFKKEYKSRGDSEDIISLKMKSRELDEVKLIKDSKIYANYTIKMS